ncbi:maltokinase N-terminal cap-like domain-containing protein [Lentzea sp. NPDC054927]
MVKIHAGAKLTPSFRDFLPVWVASRPWYRGNGALWPIGFFRFEDPAGQVGVETHLLQDGPVVYQVPLTYRSAPLAGGALVTTAEHSVLGTRWIYDAVTDPVWIAAILDLVATGGVSDSAARSGYGPVVARGAVIRPVRLTPETAVIDLDRRIVPGTPPGDAVGVVNGSWYQDGVEKSGRLAVIRQTGPKT